MAYGKVKIGNHPDGSAETFLEEDVDFEQTWWEGNLLVIKSYDHRSMPVYVKLSADMLMEELLGFTARVEVINDVVTQEPPRPEER